MRVTSWINTDKHVFNSIYFEHREALVPFGTFTDVSGDSYTGYGYPYILTEWGFRNADAPIMRHVRKNPSRIETEEIDEYSLAVILDVEE